MSNVPDMWEGFGKAKYDMTTFDEVLVDNSKRFMDRAKKEGKPFFLYHNTTRMHVWTFLSPKYRAMMNSETNFGLEEAGMKQLDDAVGALMRHLDDIGEADNTLVIFSTDNGAEVFTWPDGGMTPFKGTKGTAYEGGFRAPCIARWPGRIKPRHGSRTACSRASTWFPTMLAAAGNPNIVEQLKKGATIGDRSYKNHLDGYNQTDLLTDKGPSARHEFFYFVEANLGAVRIDDFKYQFFEQPNGWPTSVTVDMPIMVNIRQDPFERTPSIRGESLNTSAGGYMNDFMAPSSGASSWCRRRWRHAKTAIEFPPMQDPASFNLEAVKQQVDARIRSQRGQ